MIYSLESETLQFSLRPDQACWDLSSRRGDALALEGVHMSISYRRDNTHSKTLESLDQVWQLYQISDEETQSSLHGPLLQRSLMFEPDANGLRCNFTFALLSEKPLFLSESLRAILFSRPAYAKRAHRWVRRAWFRCHHGSRFEAHVRSPAHMSVG